MKETSYRIKKPILNKFPIPKYFYLTWKILRFDKYNFIICFKVLMFFKFIKCFLMILRIQKFEILFSEPIFSF